MQLGRLGELLVLGGLLAGGVMFAFGSGAAPAIVCSALLGSGVVLIITSRVAIRRLNERLAREHRLSPDCLAWMESCWIEEWRRYVEIQDAYAGGDPAVIRRSVQAAELGVSPQVLDELVAVIQRTPRFDENGTGKGTGTVTMPDGQVRKIKHYFRAQNF
jgi:hypothetical protein